jgi:hypothetical protein
MAGGKLTDKAIKNAKRGEQLVILSDGGGLQPVADANGRKALELRLSVWWQAEEAGDRAVRQGSGPRAT